MATRWRMPPESCSGRCVGELGEPHDAEQLVDPLGAVGLRPSRRTRGRRRCSPRTDLPREQRVGLEHHPAVGPGPDDEVAVDRAPRRRSAVSSPPTMLSSVDLPQPDAPTMHTSSPASTCEVDRRRGRPPSGSRRRPGTPSPTRTATCAGRRHRDALRPRGRAAAGASAGARSLTQADQAEHDEQGEHRSTCAEALGPDDPEGEALLGGEQLGHHEHQPGRGQVDAGHVDDARAASGGGSPGAAPSSRPAPSV